MFHFAQHFICFSIFLNVSFPVGIQVQVLRTCLSPGCLTILFLLIQKHKCTAELPVALQCSHSLWDFGYKYAIVCALMVHVVMCSSVIWLEKKRGTRVISVAPASSFGATFRVNCGIMPLIKLRQCVITKPVAKNFLKTDKTWVACWPYVCFHLQPRDRLKCSVLVKFLKSLRKVDCSKTLCVW